VAIYLADFRRQHSGSRVIVVLGMMQDKDREGILDHLLPYADEVIATQARIPRSATARELEASLRARGRTASMVPDPADAIGLARRMAAPDDLILVTGSLMLVGEAKAILLGCGLSPLRG
jgi:dihydrofolate synthase/folylpolyglutamate synthase